PNGSGKTTLLKIMLGLLPPSSGEVTLLNQPLATYQAKARARTIAYVSQQPALSFPLTVRELVALGRYPHGGRGRESPADTRTIENALDRTAAKDLSNRQFNSLSGGEKQKVLIARALAQSARVLLLDEPTLHLDLNFQLQILSLLKRLCVDKGITVITVLHDVNLLSLFADKALLLSGGIQRGFGSVAEVIDENSIKDLLGVDMKAIDSEVAGARYFVPRQPCNR
ncbi:MAG TPA: ABC transporter ATP-binding protein, partial [Candidatus Binatia bacterium]|nr:ABC transporter ATP-binding protein [Candidatus Binatia bacterium]